MCIILYMLNGLVKTDIIEASELEWYFKNTTVYRVEGI